MRIERRDCSPLRNFRDVTVFHGATLHSNHRESNLHYTYVRRTRSNSRYERISSHYRPWMSKGLAWQRITLHRKRRERDTHHLKFLIFLAQASFSPAPAGLIAFRKSPLKKSIFFSTSQNPVQAAPRKLQISA